MTAEYRKIGKAQTSLQVNIPSKFVKALGLRNLDIVKIEQIGERIIIEKVPE